MIARVQGQPRGTAWANAVHGFVGHYARVIAPETNDLRIESTAVTQVERQSVSYAKQASKACNISSQSRDGRHSPLSDNRAAGRR